ncbi:MucB/RseB C-terminal domain-containing protein [Aestuariibacter halophilus]|uniref:MucB/RseB C-terminal domain-containing protein n=1 Tax=Fluctibacter halophilus TaxID=226011 RepID=A0ABS8G291_9ALTE|nr:MucB/RseB C-terminal domain-containing protein [Aestuariibacter halophilus]MCC2614699.1 MucB/RseB C-terminal domain-containing protein [Aestuariibacter halophilus]
MSSKHRSNQRKPVKINLNKSLRVWTAVCCLSGGLVASFATLAQSQTPDTDIAVSSYPSDSPEAWLAKMANAFTSLNYQMSFVLLKPGMNAQPYLWRHGIAPDGTSMEQLNLLNGPGREVLRVGNEVSYFEPNVPPYTLRSTIINGPLPMAFFRDPLQLSGSYEFMLVGRSRVSGRAAQQLRVVSRDKSRFGLNLWLDQETGLPLKMNRVDLQGQLLEQIQVTALDVTAEADDYFSRIELAKLPEVVTFPPSPRSSHQWQIDFMPTGMQLVKWDVHRLPITGDVVEYVMLSDGIVDISIYLQPASASRVTEDVLLRHESDTFLSRRQGDAHVTVIGKLPAQTANAIAASVKLVTP